jgi:hypothetical protein
VILGDGLELPDHPDHANLRAILDRLRKVSPRTEVFGYIPLGPKTGLDAATIALRARLWALAGATGIFYDEAGHDFGVSLARVVESIRAARRQRLTVCLNAFDLSEIERGTRDPQHGALIGSGDAILIESFGVRLGKRQTLDDTAARMRSVTDLRKRTGVRVFGNTTATEERPSDVEDFAFAQQLAGTFELDAFGWGTPGYGAQNSRLDWPSWPGRVPR